MPKLSNTQKYAILYLHNTEKKSIKQISDELKISKNTVNSIVENNKEPEIPQINKEDKTKKVMIRETAGKKINSVSIMTQAGSQITDEHLKNMGNYQKDTSGYIFRPRS
jgi:hypothetical protein